MKTSKLILALLFFSTLMSAQVAINVNIGTAPAWAPANVETRYYYLPEIETYYDVNTSHYIYINNGQWVRERVLPVRYRHYDLYRGNKVVIADRGYHPYSHFHEHKVKYHKVKAHKSHSHYYADSHRDKGYHKGNGKGHGKKHK